MLRKHKQEYQYLYYNFYKQKLSTNYGYICYWNLLDKKKIMGKIMKRKTVKWRKHIFNNSIDQKKIMGKIQKWLVMVYFVIESY